jgi:HTH-type transcriptional regulator/antitoxin HigA
MSSTARFPFRPDYTIPPGATLRHRLAQIEVSQSDLAARSGLSTKHINQIIQGVAPITQETALILERVTGISAGIWNKLEATYRETLLRGKHRDLTPEDEQWIARLPLKALRQHGHLPQQTDKVRTFEAALAFFGVADRLAWERIWMRPVASFKRSPAFVSDPAAVASWIRLGQLESRKIETEPYNPTAFRSAIREIRRLTREPDGDKVAATCAAAGVTVVFVKELAKSRISGATWWSTPARAVIALSDRYKRDDFLWFTFFHEAGHVLLHSKKETFIDDGSEEDTVEEEANRFAADLLIPPDEAPRLSTLSTNSDVVEFAARIGIAPGIVVGRLHRDKLWDWKKGNDLRAEIRIVEA